jgi:hypothetical protein
MDEEDLALRCQRILCFFAHLLRLAPSAGAFISVIRENKLEASPSESSGSYPRLHSSALAIKL